MHKGITCIGLDVAVPAGRKAKWSFAVPAGGLAPPLTGQYCRPIPG